MGPRRSDGIHPYLGVRRGTAIVLLRQREGPTDRSACFLRISSAVPRSRAAFLSAATASLFRAFHAQKSGAVALLNPRILSLAYPDFFRSYFGRFIFRIRLIEQDYDSLHLFTCEPFSLLFFSFSVDKYLSYPNMFKQIKVSKLMVHALHLSVGNSNCIGCLDKRQPRWLHRGLLRVFVLPL